MSKKETLKLNPNPNQYTPEEEAYLRRMAKILPPRYGIGKDKSNNNIVLFYLSEIVKTYPENVTEEEILEYIQEHQAKLIESGDDFMYGESTPPPGY